MAGHFYYDQQRALMSRPELEEAISEKLSLMVTSGGHGEPDDSMLRKADSVLNAILALVDVYARR